MGLRSRIGNLEDRMTNLLNKFPGYTGYRDKETRRDDDKALRESIASSIRQYTDTLTRYNSEIAAQRDFENISRLESVVDRLRLLGDRIRNASYGYGGIFSDKNIDESALDQLRQFDLALELDVKNIGDLLDKLTATNPPGADQLRDLGNEIERMQIVFDGRSNVIEVGQVNRDEKVLALLAPKDDTAPSPLLGIHKGDTFSVLGDNFVVNATIRISSEIGTILLARVDQAEAGATWFVGSDIANIPTAKVTESDGNGDGYQSLTPASAKVDTESGSRESVPAYYSVSISGETIEIRVSMADDLRIYRGQTVRDIDIEVYGAAN